MAARQPVLDGCGGHGVTPGDLDRDPQAGGELECSGGDIVGHRRGGQKQHLVVTEAEWARHFRLHPFDLAGIGFGFETELPGVRLRAITLGHGELGGIDQRRQLFGGEVHQSPVENRGGHGGGGASGYFDKPPQGGQQRLAGSADLTQSGHAQLCKSTGLGGDVLNRHTGDHEIELDGVHPGPSNLDSSFREWPIIGEIHPPFICPGNNGEYHHEDYESDSESHTNSFKPVNTAPTDPRMMTAS